MKRVSGEGMPSDHRRKGDLFVRFEVEFGYLVMNDVMRVVKEMRPEVLEQRFDNLCTMQLSIRAGRADALLERLQKIEGIQIETK